MTSGRLPNRQHSKPEVLGLESGRKNIMLVSDLWRDAEIGLALEYCLLKGAEILKQTETAYFSQWWKKKFPFTFNIFE